MLMRARSLHADEGDDGADEATAPKARVRSLRADEGEVTAC